MAMRRSGWWYPAVFLPLCAASFRFGPDGVAWFWDGQAIVAAVLVAMAAIFAALAAWASRRPPA